MIISSDNSDNNSDEGLSISLIRGVQNVLDPIPTPTPIALIPKKTALKNTNPPLDRGKGRQLY